MANPALYTVPSTAVYRSHDGKDSRRFNTGALIDYHEAVRFGMVAAPAALPPSFGGLRPDLDQLSVDDDAVLAISPLVVTSWPMLVGSLASITAYTTEWPFGDSDHGGYLYIRRVHLARATQARLSCIYRELTDAGVFLNCQYSGDDRATWHEFGDGLHTIATDVDADVSHLFIAESDWQTIPTEARDSVWIRLAVGGGVTDDAEADTQSSIQITYLSLDAR